MNPTTSQDALAQLQSQQSSAQNPNDILAAQRQQLGVQQSQDTVTGLRGAINNTTKLLQQVAPSVMGRTAGSLVTSAQANRQVQNEQAPISQNLTTQNTQYGEANTDLAKLQQQAAEAASGIYQGQQDKLSYLQNVYNTLFQREETARAAAAAEAARQEQIRQFNEQLNFSRQQQADANRRAASSGGSSNGGYDLSALLGAKSGGAEKNYVGNNDLRGRLAYAASKGDNNASVALKYVGNDGKYSINPQTLGTLKGVKAALDAVGATNVYRAPGGGGGGSGW